MRSQVHTEPTQHVGGHGRICDGTVTMHPRNRTLPGRQHQHDAQPQGSAGILQTSVRDYAGEKVHGGSEVRGEFVSLQGTRAFRGKSSRSPELRRRRNYDVAILRLSFDTIRRQKVNVQT
jgi:hypothetical protein